MKKIKYYFKRLKGMDYKTLRLTVKEVKRITNKNSISIYIDIFLCSIKYQCGFNDYREFEFYLLNDKQRDTFITSGINRQIVSYYNNLKFNDQFENKTNFHRRFEKYINRDFLDLEVASFEEFEEFIGKHKKIVTKVLDEVEGFGVNVIDYSDNDNIDLKLEYDRLKANKQFLVEEFFVQHNKMSELSVKSVNTLRIITFLNEDNEVVIMNRVLKAGLSGELDNYGQGGMYSILNEDGVVVRPFVDKKNRIHTKHPITDYDFIGFEVPKFDEVISLAKGIAQEIKDVRYVGWDFAIGEKSVEVIEGNYYSYPFQPLPSISENKEGYLNKYKQVMTELFKEGEN